MNKYIQYLSGKKTYILGTLIVIFNGLLFAEVIAIEPKTIDAVNYVLGSLTAITLRLGISKSVK